MEIINRTKVLQSVQIVLANGTLDSVNIQPNGRTSLPKGATLNPDKVEVYKATLKVIADKAPAATAQAPAGSGSDETATDTTVKVTASTK